MEKIEFENQLFEAIKKDDLKSFNFLMLTKVDLNLCFGRFPILSLLYLYSSFKILKEYEKKLLPIHNFKQVDERLEIYRDFKLRAGKTIRLFIDDEIVYPVLMLAVLDEKIILKKYYKILYKNVEIVEKFNKIYNLTQKSKVKVTEKEIFFTREKLKTKHYVLFSVLAFILALFIAFPSVLLAIVPKNNGLGTEKYPTKIATAGAFMQAIKNGKGNYILTDDIEINAADIRSKDFSGVIDGNEFLIKINGEINSPFVKNLSGTIKNLEILLNDNDIKITQNSSIISEKVLGNIENVKIYGKINVEIDGQKIENSTGETVGDVYFSLISYENEGTISNCQTNVSATLVNKNETNAYYSNFVGINKEKGIITNCLSIGGVVQADTVDLSGIASENYGEISLSENKTELSQISSKEWHPNVAGISMTNYGKIDGCKNYGSLLAESTLDVAGSDESGNKNTYFVYVGGIACSNVSSIINCRNFGIINAKGIVSSVMAGGIVAQNYYDDKDGVVESSLSKSTINSYSKEAWVYVGGVAGFNSSYIVGSGFDGEISANSESTENENNVYKTILDKATIDKPMTVFAGGVVGINNSAYVQKCYADVDYLNTSSSDESYKIFAAVIGCVGVFEVKYPEYTNNRYTYALTYVVNNYYVAKNKGDTKIAGAYEIFATYSQNEDSNYYISSGKISEITDSMIYSCYGKSNSLLIEKSSLDEIPAEVRIDD